MVTFAIGGGFPVWMARSRSRWWDPDPTFAIAYMVYVLICRVVGPGSIGGSSPRRRARISDMAGK